MNFEWNTEQKMLQKSVRDFFRKELPSDTMRELLAGETGHSEKMWRKMAALGWTGLMLPEAYGGSEYGFAELTLLMEEMGRFLYSGPFFATVVLGGLSVLSHGTTDQKEELLPPVVAGKKRLTLAFLEPGTGGVDAAGLRMPAEKRGGDYILNGTKLFVPDAHLADHILCAARTGKETDPEQGISVFIVDAQASGVVITPMETIGGRKQSEVAFNDVAVPGSRILGKADDGWPVVAAAVRRAALARSAEMIGGARAVLDQAVEHARTRVQFRRPIGSFQSIQHHITNMWISVINARLLCWKAASQLDAGSPAAARTVAMAKMKAGEALRFVSAKGHQILGAVGFSEEYDMHFYYRRAISDDLAYGDRPAQQEAIAGTLGL